MSDGIHGPTIDLKAVRRNLETWTTVLNYEEARAVVDKVLTLDCLGRPAARDGPNMRGVETRLSALRFMVATFEGVLDSPPAVVRAKDGKTLPLILGGDHTQAALIFTGDGGWSGVVLSRPQFKLLRAIVDSYVKVGRGMNSTEVKAHVSPDAPRTYRRMQKNPVLGQALAPPRTKRGRGPGDGYGLRTF